MKRSIFLIVLLFPPGARAGNEAGGSWVANRFRAKGFEIAALLCDPRKGAPLLSAEEIRRLESAIAGVPVSVSKENRDEVVEGVGIRLALKRWERDLDLERDVYASVFFLYLTAMKAPDAAGKTARFDSRKLMSRGLSEAGAWLCWSDGSREWRLSRELKDAKEAFETCQALNREPQRGWELAGNTALAAEGPRLKTFLDGQSFLTEKHYRIWAGAFRALSLPSAAWDIEAGGPAAGTPGEKHAVACIRY